MKLANHARHRIAALWRDGMKPKGRGVAARGTLGVRRFIANERIRFSSGRLT